MFESLSGLSYVITLTLVKSEDSFRRLNASTALRLESAAFKDAHKVKTASWNAKRASNARTKKTAWEMPHASLIFEAYA